MSEYLDEPRLQQVQNITTQPEVTIERQLSTAEQDLIEISGLNKWYGQFHVLRDVNLNVKKGEKNCYLRPLGFW